MENPITRAEHEEFRRRLEEENKRQDARIGILEESVWRRELRAQSIGFSLHFLCNEIEGLANITCAGIQTVDKCLDVRSKAADFFLDVVFIHVQG